jgi:Phosphoesterase family
MAQDISKVSWQDIFRYGFSVHSSQYSTLIIVTFDEGEGLEKKSNHIYTIFLGEMVKKGLKVSERHDHYDVLRTIESNFALPSLNYGDKKAKVITGIWN